MSDSKMIILTFPNYTDLPVKTYWRRSTLEKIPYFEARFRSGMIDSQQEEIIMEEDPQLFSQMMQHALGKDTQERLLTMADYYGVDIVVEKKEKPKREKLSISFIVPARSTEATLTFPGYKYVNQFRLFKSRNTHFNVVISVNGRDIDADPCNLTSHSIAIAINKYSKGKEFELKLRLSDPVQHDLEIFGEMSIDN